MYQYVAHNSMPCKLLTSEGYKQLPPFVNSASYVQTHKGVQEPASENVKSSMQNSDL